MDPDKHAIWGCAGEESLQKTLFRGHCMGPTPCPPKSAPMLEFTATSIGSLISRLTQTSVVLQDPNAFLMEMLRGKAANGRPQEKLLKPNKRYLTLSGAWSAT